ncbi:MAG: MauE/DoxX family redox-associated membrane protein [Acidimicrobiales bacterium]
MSILALLLRFCLAVVFLHAGLVKVILRGEFRLAVRNYRLVPERLLSVVVIGLPLIEAACGLLLAVGVETGPVAALILLLLATFVGAISVNLLRGRTFSCGCSGRSSPNITWRHVIANSVLAIMAVVVSAWGMQPLTVVPGWGFQGNPSLSQGQAIAVLLAAAGGAALALLVREALAVRRAMYGTSSPPAAKAGLANEVIA